jgi:hypothetical protein
LQETYNRLLKKEAQAEFPGSFQPAVFEPVETTPAPGEPPYKGLKHFDVNDKALFFGRETLTTRLVAYVQTHPLLAVIGASGSGKSSLLRAGLIPAFLPRTFRIRNGKLKSLPLQNTHCNHWKPSSSRGSEHLEVHHRGAESRDPNDLDYSKFRKPQKSRRMQNFYSSLTSLKRSLPSAKVKLSESALSTNCWLYLK